MSASGKETEEYLPEISLYKGRHRKNISVMKRHASLRNSMEKDIRIVPEGRITLQPGSFCDHFCKRKDPGFRLGQAPDALCKKRAKHTYKRNNEAAWLLRKEELCPVLIDIMIARMTGHSFLYSSSLPSDHYTFERRNNPTYR